MAKMPGSLCEPLIRVIQQGEALPGRLTCASDKGLEPSGSTLTARSRRATQHTMARAVPRAADFLASLPCVVYESTAELTVRIISANAFELLGIRPEAVQGNRSLWHDRIVPEDRDRVLARLDDLEGLKIVGEEHRLIDDQGLPIRVFHGFRKVGSGPRACIRGFITPVTCRDTVGSPDSSAISQFIHKMGNHFQLMNLVIGSMRRHGTSLDEVDQLQMTIDRAVEFTQAFSQYNQAAAQFCELDLGEILRSITQSNNRLFSERRVSFEALIHESLDGVAMQGDPLLLDLALGSILQNALDATKAADRVIFEAKRSTTPSGSVVRISVADSGRGMEKETLARAADPFFTLSPERVGLGLSMAMRVVQMHGGILTITSDEGQGTRVEIVLPLEKSFDHVER